ncbi:DEAD/DEAH box helicase family protein [Corynebacterium sp. CCUG 71335]|uniref:DEAD/DEAH box helicase n=1 Tax=Corynebacterium sp. CCUG 71335 TaxID=2823892 RepID=UPI00210A6E69|nr:DEAD/DEAH box helicase family protein [Corynebacterium sp. CCUG 71335]MCQ4620719.1 DEAD/DEAH box helicase family protein [Corynebacterium sp. CCUG 71335]
MKYTLMPYQETASDTIMERIDKAAGARSIDQQAVFALSAPTGAGKTVIATSVFERILIPSDDRVEDENAVILWLSDNPDLNEQSRYRIETASSDLATRTVTLDSSFNLPTFERGCIYFLNTQKLGKGTKLTGGRKDTQDPLIGRGDTMQVTFWDTLRNTINSDQHNLILVVDEAHRGAGRQRTDKATILRRLIEGHTPEGHTEPVPPIPTVMGISATPGAFKSMVHSMSGSRLVLDDVTVPVADVQESGLIKDIVELRIPGEEGRSFDGVFVQDAARLLADTTTRWDAYHAEQGGDGERVVPLMVVQMKDKATDEDVYQAIVAIRKGWPQIPSTAFGNVYGEHTDITAGDTLVPYIEPQKVQERTDIRVLFAKTAISTGWDCPRAEVMVSYRTARDEAHITQVIGRMVRSPLARRIEGNDLLNSVLCILPQFDRTAASTAVENINRDNTPIGPGGGSSGEGDVPVSEVVIDPVTLYPIDNEAVWQAFRALPRMVAPIRSDKPISMLLNLGIELQRDSLLDGGKKVAEDELIAIVNGYLTRYEKQVADKRDDILKVETERLVFGYAGRELSVHEAAPSLYADHHVIDEAYRAAIPVFTRALADMWVDARADALAAADPDADEDELLDEARLQLAALASIAGIAQSVSDNADDVASDWFAKYNAELAVLPDSRKAAYQPLREMATTPSHEPLTKPANRTVAPGKAGKDGELVPFDTYTGHLLTAKGGDAPLHLNEWEKHVVGTESTRSGATAWYRNPSRASAEALTAVYYDGTTEQWRNMQPDFIFFREVEGVVRPSIIDPHGHHLGDALDKLRALSNYAAEFGDQFVQILAVSGENTASLKSVDLKDPTTRTVIEKADTAAEVYEQVGRAYK